MKFNFKKNWYFLIPVAIGGYLIYKQFSNKVEDPKGDAPNPHKNENIPSADITNTPATSKDFPLKKGSNNSTVEILQTLLNGALRAQNKTLLVVDGKFGPKTEAALLDLTGNFSIGNESDLEALKKSLIQSNQLSNQLDYGWRMQSAYDSATYSMLKVKIPITLFGVKKNFQGQWVRSGKNLDLAPHNYSLDDYSIRAVTRDGNLRIEILNGNLAGMYLTEDGIDLPSTFDII